MLWITSQVPIKCRRTWTASSRTRWATPIALAPPTSGTHWISTQRRTYPDNRDLINPTIGAIAYIAKLDSDGAIVWTRKLAATVAATNVRFFAIAIDERGNSNPADDRIYVGGRMDDQFSYAGACADRDPDRPLRGVHPAH